MGAKKLKAIVVKGSGGISVADHKGLLKKLQDVTQMVNQSVKSQNFAKFGTNMVVAITNNAGMLPTHNFQHGIFPDAAGRLDKDGFYPLKTGDHACTGCVMPCAKIIEMKEGQYAGSRLEAPEYESIAMLGSNLGVDDTTFVTEANLLCNQLGLDTISMGNVLGFAMECYERGLLTKEQTEGFDLYFGNKEAALQLIKKTARLDGFGALLAQGVQKMAKKIGKEAEHYAMHVKGVELPGYDPRGAFGAALTYAVNPRGGCHRRAWPPQKEVVGDVPPYTVEGKAEMIRDMFNERIIPHHFIVCDFYLNMVPVPLDFYAECLSLVTGEQFTVERLQWIAERTETLIRMFNCREGLNRKDDKTPDRILNETLSEGAAKGQLIGKAGFEKMLDEYYALRGWDENGVPKLETLAKYELNL
jgi:aldehyde:ferredoxin oxidoreductase